MMSKNWSNWVKCSTALVRECEIEDGSKRTLKPTHCLFVAGWEDRAVYSPNRIEILPREVEQLPTKTGKRKPPKKLKPSCTILNFELPPEQAAISGKQVKKLSKLGDSTELKLLASDKLQENLARIKEHYQSADIPAGSTLFFDITSTPKFYIQSLVPFFFEQDIFSHLVFGYCPGVYLEESFNERVGGHVTFPIVRDIRGPRPPFHKKQVAVILGAERANCYALLNKIGPDRIDLIQTGKRGYAAADESNRIQTEKIKSEYGDSIRSELTVDAFSIVELINGIKSLDCFGEKGMSKSIFVGSAKPMALGVALLATVFSEQFEVRARKAAIDRYPNHKPLKNMMLYEVVKLDSPQLPGDKIWPLEDGVLT